MCASINKFLCFLPDENGNRQTHIQMIFAFYGKFRRLVANPAEIYSVGMTRKLRNWNYRNVTDFLRKNGFSYLKPLKGSHQAWIKRGENDGPDRIVEVSLPSDSYPPKTMNTMIRKSGIPRDEWIKWAGS
jgi:hypothetical protein